ncbi:RNA-directed DNA polymerase from mobile element jockey-like [Brachionus plicatilis]|uniref:RNA-directed DNA polymerase from mobile element jockey-like n=1 Tax=Brachionus plicatilis TaxID=10195 RepID=A0A3M7T5P4_BRAPC|nr:RNA-directed DNA polymerase from mobile element jockey-like [Brachionus plicatilis]
MKISKSVAASKKGTSCIELNEFVLFLLDRIEKLEKKKGELSSKTTKEQEMTSLSMSKSSWACVTSKGTKVATPDQLSAINAFANEAKERSEREKNIVIFGVETTNDSNADKLKEDEEKVSAIFEKIGTGDLQRNKVKRLRSQKGSGPLIIELNSIQDRNEVLKNAKKLRNDATSSGIYINPDMTLAERASLLASGVIESSKLPTTEMETHLLVQNQQELPSNNDSNDNRNIKIHSNSNINYNNNRR